MWGLGLINTKCSKVKLHKTKLGEDGLKEPVYEAKSVDESCSFANRERDSLSKNDKKNNKSDASPLDIRNGDRFRLVAQLRGNGINNPQKHQLPSPKSN